MSDTEHWTTPSGYDLQRIYGTLDRDPEGRPIIGYAYALVLDNDRAGIYRRFDLNEAEFEALRKISAAR
jgi:hypothetical protein